MSRPNTLALRNIERDIEHMRISSISLFEDEHGLGANEITLSYPQSGTVALVLSPKGDDEDMTLRVYRSADRNAPEETVDSYFGDDAE